MGGMIGLTPQIHVSPISQTSPIVFDESSCAQFTKISYSPAASTLFLSNAYLRRSTLLLCFHQYARLLIMALKKVTSLSSLSSLFQFPWVGTFVFITVRCYSVCFASFAASAPALSDFTSSLSILIFKISVSRCFLF